MNALKRVKHMAEQEEQGHCEAATCLSEFDDMKRFRGNRTLAILLFLLISVHMLLAASPVSKLLSLVPPGAQLVAGLKRTLTSRPDGFLLVSYKNAVDRSDFISLAGVDDSMSIDQMIFAAGGSDTSTLGEHSILVSGHFDQRRIFKAAVENGAAVSEFKGFQVLVQHPFERELGTFTDVRWLAVIDSTVALFGTRLSIQQELERHLAGSPVDPALTQKLARMRRDNEAWSILEVLKRNDTIEQALGSLDPILARLLHDGNSFQCGVRYGRKVEVEYEVTVPSSVSASAISSSFMPSSVGENRKGSSLLPRIEGLAEDRAFVRGVVKIAMTRYAAWLAQFARSSVVGRRD